LPRVRVVGDAGEPATQLDGGRQLALLIEGGPDRGGVFLGDSEHAESVGAQMTGDKLGVSVISTRCAGL
jgi:hypothetical protein